MLRRRLKDGYAVACGIRIEDEALAVAGREGRNRMATATGLIEDQDPVVWAVADHAQFPTRGAHVPGVGARIEPDLVRAPDPCGRAEDGDLAVVGVDQRYAVSACAEKIIGIVDGQTARPAIAAGHVDAAQEDQLSGFRVEDIDATVRRALRKRLINVALLRIPDRLLDAAARVDSPRAEAGFPTSLSA